MRSMWTSCAGQVPLYIPADCAHGFQALTDIADVSYFLDRAHDPAGDVAIAFDDEDLAIPWPLSGAAVSSRTGRSRKIATPP